jgi:hypothetical protein
MLAVTPIACLAQGMAKAPTTMTAGEMGRRGGKARAAALSPTEKAEIARKGANERWARARSIPKAMREGTLQIGNLVIPCAIVTNEKGDVERLISERGMSEAMGYVRSGSDYAQKRSEEVGGNLPVFLSQKRLKPFISDKLRLEGKLVPYRSTQGGLPADGIPAKLIPEICNVFLKARDAGVLAPDHAIVKNADLLIRGLAVTGIVALVDEATGYQDERARDELQIILSKYISEELMPWTKRFPDEFFRQIFRLHNWKYAPGNVKRPGYVGKLINQLVYEPLPPGVLSELKRLNPRIDGRRKHAHHQHLSDETGQPHLDKQISSVTVLMRASRDQEEFRRLFASALAPEGSDPENDPQQTLPFPPDDSAPETPAPPRVA